MRIAIDARLNAYRQGGISQYTRQLLTALPDTARDDQFVSLQHRDHLRPLALAPNVVRRSVYTPPHHRFEQWTMPLELLLARPNVAHFPDFVAPLRRPCPAVVTIHDLAFMHYPEILDDAARAYYGQVRTNAPRAEGIIAVSEATRQDIAQFIDIPIEQIDVIYEAAAPLYKPIPLRAGEARVLNSTPVEAGSFMLFVSTLEPRKNLPTLLQALRICLDRRPDAGYRLVIVGRRGWRDEPIFAAVRDLKLADHVLFAGGVGQYDLRWLYNACRIYINPSLYEGFGLPLLEAMACGAPCLAAATSSLPEIGGNAAIYVPPLDADVWADEIEALWDDSVRRAEMGRMGQARAQQFSWARAARETMAVYRRAATERALPTTATPVQAGLDLPIPTRAPMSPAGPRTCVQCGADLKPTSLQHRLAMRADAMPASAEPIAPRAWACARCGHVELVVDWAGAEDGTDVLHYAPLDEGRPTAADAAELEDVPAEAYDAPAEAYDATAEAYDATAEAYDATAEADGGDGKGVLQYAPLGDGQPTAADAAELESSAAELESSAAELESSAAAAYGSGGKGVLQYAPLGEGQPTAADAAELESSAAEAYDSTAEAYDATAEVEASAAEAYDSTAEAYDATAEADGGDGKGVLQYAPLGDGRPTPADVAELESSAAEAYDATAEAYDSTAEADGGGGKGVLQYAPLDEGQPTAADAAELESSAAEAYDAPAEAYDATAEADGGDGKGVLQYAPLDEGQPTAADAAELESSAAEAYDAPAEAYDATAEADGGDGKGVLQYAPLDEGQPTAADAAELESSAAEANGALPESEMLPATTPALPPESAHDGQPALALPEDAALDGGVPHSNGKHTTPAASVKSNARSMRRSSGDTATTTTTKRRQNKTKRK